MLKFELWCTAVYSAVQLVTQFLRYALDKITIYNFAQWKRDVVKSETFINFYQLEKEYGTALILYYSSMRANNIKEIISDSVIDVQTDYMTKKMQIEAPNLYNYLKDKLFTNKTGKMYSSEPHDERHEEYNKRGLSFQDMRSTENFETGFLVCDSFAKLQKSVLED